MKKVVYVLFVTQNEEQGAINVGVGPVCWTQTDAGLARRSLEAQGVRVQIVAREVRGDMPVLPVRE